MRYNLVASNIFVCALLGLVGCAQYPQTIKIDLTRGGYELKKDVESKVSYYGYIKVGTPAKPFKVVFDTSTGDSWLPHYTWNPFAGNLHYGTGYIGKDSSTSKKFNTKREIDYRGTILEGKPYTDMVIYSYNSNFASKETRQGFLAISDASNGQFKEEPYDGVVGMAPVTQSANGIPNILIGLREAGVIGNSEFSLWLNPTLDVAQGGELMLGGVDQSRYVGSFYYHKLTGYNNWQVAIQKLLLGQQQVGCIHGCQAIFNTGITDVYGPAEDVRRIYDLLTVNIDRDTGLPMIECDRVRSLPSIIFMIDGINYPLLSTQYVRYIKKSKTLSSKIKCYLAIKTHNEENNKWILGNNFLGQYYTRFDFENRQIGFATLRASH